MALSDNIKQINEIQKTLNNNTPINNSLTSTYQADGNGLPYNKVPSERQGQFKRNIITWFVPEFGAIKMYVNPNSISYKNDKLISKELTKGGYSLQYWGEDLTTISISGTTGSSGIEGINVLEEIYRAEQYAFDSTGLSLAAHNSSSDLTSNVSSLFSSNTVGNIVGGISGTNALNANLAPQNINSLAQLAFSVEMYYNGWVFRGYFKDLNVTESADDFLMKYNITFIATQRRGYRTNNFGFQRSAKDGASRYDTANSLSKTVITG